MGNAITIIGNGRSYVGSFNQWGRVWGTFSCSNGHFIDSKGAITIEHILNSCFVYFQCQYKNLSFQGSPCAQLNLKKEQPCTTLIFSGVPNLLQYHSLTAIFNNNIMDDNTFSKVIIIFVTS